MNVYQRHPAHLDQRPPRPPKLLQTKTAIFSFGGLRGLGSGCVGCLWMQLFMVVPMTPSAAVSDFGGRRYHWFVPFNFLLSSAAPHLYGVLVLITGNKFIAGTVSLSPAVIVIAGIKDTSDHWKSVTRIIRRCRWHQCEHSLSPMSLIPVINIHSRISPRIFEKIRNGPNGILGGPGDNDSWKKPEAENLVSDSL